MKDIEQLRQFAQKQAEEFQEPVLLILDPPAMPVHGFKSAIPYWTLESHASQEEKQAATARLTPKEPTP